MLLSRAVIFSVPGQDVGTVPVFSGSTWEGLNPGTAGQYLKTRGPGQTPIWDWPGGSSLSGTTQTTDATWTAVGITIPVALLSTMQVDLHIAAVSADGTKRAVWRSHIALCRASGAAIVLDDLIVHVYRTDPTWDYRLVVSGGDVAVEVAGSGGTTIRWQALVEYTEVTA